MKKQQQIKRAMRMVQGLIISWADQNPLTANPNIKDGKITHTKPVLRLNAEKIWRDYGDWLRNKNGLSWRVEITVVFLYPNGTEQHESRCVVANASLNDIALACEPTIKEALRHGENATETRFKVQCLGTHHSDADFKDYPDACNS